MSLKRITCFSINKLNLSYNRWRNYDISGSDTYHSVEHIKFGKIDECIDQNCKIFGVHQ